MTVILVGCGKMGSYHLNAIRNFEIVDSVSVVEPGELSKKLLNNETHFSSLQECLASGLYDLAVSPCLRAPSAPILNPANVAAYRAAKLFQGAPP